LSALISNSLQIVALSELVWLSQILQLAKTLLSIIKKKVYAEKLYNKKISKTIGDFSYDMAEDIDALALHLKNSKLDSDKIFVHFLKFGNN